MQIRPLLENLARLIEKRTKMRGLIWAESNILLSFYSSADIGFRILVSALKADTWTAKLLNENPFRLAKFTMAQKINVFFFDPQSPPQQMAKAIACWVVHGDAVATKTPTGFLGSTSRKALIHRALVKPKSALSLGSSTSDSERPCNTKRQQKNLKPVLRRFVETTLI